MDELPKNLTALIEQARVAHEPSAADARRVGAALSGIIPGFVPVTLLPQSAAHGATDVVSQSAHGAALEGAWLGSGAAKLLAAVVTAALIATAVVVQRSSSEPSPAAAHVRASAPERRPKTAPTLDPPAAPMAEPAVAPNAAPPRSAGAVPLIVAPAAPQLPEAATTITPARQRSVTRGAKTPAPSAGTGANSAELELIEHALAALHGNDPALAERLLRQHAARFPNGNLTQERSGLTVIALCQQGRTLEAAPLQLRFMQEAADSPLAGRVARACATR